MRLTDGAAKGAQSIWKLYYQGSVGGQALTGIPVVRRLRKRFTNSRLWPFETGWKALAPGDLDGIGAVMCEIWPSMLKGQAGPGEVKDLAQVRNLAEHFAALDEKGRLSALFGPAKGQAAPAEIVEQEEGWILGA